MADINTYIILIGGGSASGKTTLANHLQSRLSPHSIIISLDNYYKDLSHLTMQQRKQNNFDHPQSIEFNLLLKHLRLLRKGYTVKIPIYNFITHTRKQKTQKVEPHSILIIEGLHILTYRPIRNIANLKVFVELSDDLRFIRRIQRDILERRRTLEETTNQYLHTVRPMYEQFILPSKRYADLVVNGENLEEAVSKILSVPSLKKFYPKLFLSAKR
ncbi:MAG TPA: uridine kinase [Candidatus Hydrogenedens sp.]|nr:uridine kinase [Candidatus Hydrogenedens sp.]